MKCPFSHFMRRDGVTREIPCGKCNICIENRRRDYVIRLNLAKKEYNSIYFITLTFNEEELPSDRDGCIRKFQLYMKRLRKYWPFDEKLKYFCVLERGEVNKRFHWHQLLFSKSQATKEHIRQIVFNHWQYGLVDVGYLKNGGISYVCKYLFKDDYKMLISRGLGFPVFKEEDIRHMVDGYHLDGYNYMCGNSIRSKLRRCDREVYNYYQSLKDLKSYEELRVDSYEDIKQRILEYEQYLIDKASKNQFNCK